VKKKDSISLFIDSDKLGKLGIMIRPEGARKTSRFETNYIVYQEEKNYELIDLPDGKYKHPMVIDASDFQKIKRLTTVGKTINVVMQKNNYLAFSCDAGDVYSSELGFGELLDDPESDNEDSEDDAEAEDEENDTEDADAEAEDEENDTEDADAEAEEEEKEGAEEEEGYDSLVTNIRGLYEASFYASILNLLVKLPGLCTQMQFYSPTIPHFPLKIKMNAGQSGTTLGEIEVYIKDIPQITYEESIRQENETVAVTAKGKTKTKKK
jgi:hypothetical protein